MANLEKQQQGVHMVCCITMPMRQGLMWHRSDTAERAMPPWTKEEADVDVVCRLHQRLADVYPATDIDVCVVGIFHQVGCHVDLTKLHSGCQTDDCVPLVQRFARIFTMVDVVMMCGILPALAALMLNRHLHVL